MKRPCIDCGTLVEKGNRCPLHQRQFRSGRAARGLTGQRGSTHRWRKIRRRVLERDGFRCVECDAPYPLEVDHIDGDPTNDKLTNLQTLCTDCHRRKHASSRKAERWKHLNRT
jgi:5-methylcytosine-specific restriction endonuclease McrA